MIQDQLQGLILPPKEAVWGIEYWLGLGLLLCFLALLIWQGYQKKRNNQALKSARKKLRSLVLSHHNSADSTQNKALQLASLLCNGLGIKHLDQYDPQDAQKWHDFHQRLNVLCYSSCYSSHYSINKSADLEPLFDEAKGWLAST